MVSDALKQQREQQRENKMNNALDDNKKESSNSVSVEEYKSKKRVEVRKGAEKATSLAHDIRSLALRASWLPDCSEETIKDRALDMERYLELFKGSRGEAYVGLLDLVSSEAVRKINTMESSTTFIEKVELSEENGKGAFEEELEGIKEKQFLMLKGALDSLDPEIKHEDASSYIDKEIDSALSISSRMLSIAIGTPESNRKDDIIAFNYEAGVTVKSLVELKDIILHRNIVYILRVFFKRGVPFNENFISNSIRQIVRDSASIMYNNISFSKPDTMIELGGANKGGISKGIETKIISKIDEVCRLAEIKSGDRPEPVVHTKKMIVISSGHDVAEIIMGGGLALSPIINASPSITDRIKVEELISTLEGYAITMAKTASAKKMQSPETQEKAISVITEYKVKFMKWVSADYNLVNDSLIDRKDSEEIIEQAFLRLAVNVFDVLIKVYNRDQHISIYLNPSLMMSFLAAHTSANLPLFPGRDIAYLVYGWVYDLSSEVYFNMDEGIRSEEDQRELVLTAFIRLTNNMLHDLRLLPENEVAPEEKDNTVTVRPGIIRQSGMLPIDPRLVPERLSYEPELNSNGRLHGTIKECIHKAMIQVAKRLERSVDLVNDSKALSDNAFSEIMIAIESTEELYAAFRSEEDRSDAMFEELRLIIIHSIEDLGRSLGLNNTEQMERDEDKYAFIRHMVIEAISIITSRTDEYKEKESKAIVIEFVEKMAECFCLKVFKGSKQDLLVRHISCYLIRALEEIALDAYKGTSINNATREGDFEGDFIVYMAGLDLDPNRPPVLDISCGQSVEAKENKRSGEYPPIVDDREDMIDGWREVSTANEELEELVEKITEEEEDRIQRIAQYEDVVDFFYQVNDEPSCHPMIDEFEVESRALIESLLYDSKDDNIDMYSVSDGVVEYIRAIEDDIRKRLDCDLSNLEYNIVIETRTALISIVICLMDKKNECAKKDTYFTQDGFVAGCIKIIKEAVENSEEYVATAEEKDEVIGESEAFKTWVEKMNEGARGLGARCSNRNK